MPGEKLDPRHWVDGGALNCTGRAGVPRSAVLQSVRADVISSVSFEIAVLLDRG